MIDFKDITLADRELVTSFIFNGDRRNCDLSFSNLCSWRFLFKTQIAVVDGFLAFKFYVHEKLFYMLPVGNGDVSLLIDQLIREATAEQQPFCMLGVCEGTRTKLEESMSEKFVFTANRDYADYLYLREDLTTLKGKKYQPKRNHLNRFRKLYPNYSYELITKENIDECLLFAQNWSLMNDRTNEKGTQNEHQAITYALSHFEEIGLTGGVLRVNGQLAAFTYGMPINHDTFGVHVEKADTSIEGAYTMINYEFCNQIPDSFTYINREEDLGIEGLRKAKLSYHPYKILNKHMACLKEETKPHTYELRR